MTDVAATAGTAGATSRPRAVVEHPVTAPNATVAYRQGRVVWWLAYGSVVVIGLVIAAFVRNRLVQPYIGLSLGLMLLLATLWLTRPLLAFYATLFLSTLSDFVSASWFPFTKNLSSRESIAFVADALTASGALPKAGLQRRTGASR